MTSKLVLKPATARPMESVVIKTRQLLGLRAALVDRPTTTLRMARCSTPSVSHCQCWCTCLIILFALLCFVCLLACLFVRLQFLCEYRNKSLFWLLASDFRLVDVGRTVTVNGLRLLQQLFQRDK